MYGGPCVGGSVEGPVGSDQDARGVSWVTVQAEVSLLTSQGQGHTDQDDRCERPITRILVRSIVVCISIFNQLSYEASVTCSKFTLCGPSLFYFLARSTDKQLTDSSVDVLSI